MIPHPLRGPGPAGPGPAKSGMPVPVGMGMGMDSDPRRDPARGPGGRAGKSGIMGTGWGWTPPIPGKSPGDASGTPIPADPGPAYR
jgi:hypothetical protein